MRDVNSLGDTIAHVSLNPPWLGSILEKAAGKLAEMAMTYGSDLTKGKIMLSLEGSLARMTQAAASQLGDLTKMLVTDNISACLVVRTVGSPPYFSYMIGRPADQHLAFTPFSKYVVIHPGSSTKEIGLSTSEASTASLIIQASVEGADVSAARMTAGAVRSLAVDVEEAAIKEATATKDKDQTHSEKKKLDTAADIAAMLLLGKDKEAGGKGQWVPWRC